MFVSGGRVKLLNDTHFNCPYCLLREMLGGKYKDCKSSSEALLDPEKTGLQLYLLEKSMRPASAPEGGQDHYQLKVSLLGFRGFDYLS